MVLYNIWYSNWEDWMRDVMKEGTKKRKLVEFYSFLGLRLVSERGTEKMECEKVMNGSIVDEGWWNEKGQLF